MNSGKQNHWEGGVFEGKGKVAGTVYMIYSHWLSSQKDNEQENAQRGPGCFRNFTRKTVKTSLI